MLADVIENRKHFKIHQPIDSYEGIKMRDLNTVQKTIKEMPSPDSKRPRYHSVEFSVDGIVYPYQFKLRNMSPELMHVIIMENSEILGGIEVGKILKMKYYHDDFSRSSTHYQTEITNIDRIAEGRFKGHYIVGLSIVENQNEILTH